MGCMITYGSYINRKNHLSHTVFEVTMLDTLVSVLAAVAIFLLSFLWVSILPMVLSWFLSLCPMFLHNPGGYVWAILFLFLLCVAALTSAISLMEVVVAFLVEEIKMKRTTATIVVATIIMILGTFASLSFGTWENVKIFNMNFFDLFDNVTSKIFMPLGGLMISIFTGWVLSKQKIKEEMSSYGKFPTPYYRTFVFLVKYITPLCIILVLLNQIGLGKWLGF